MLTRSLGSIVTYACGLRTDSSAWRIPIAVQWSVPAVMIVVLPWIPESPWHLVRKGQLDKAHRALTKIYLGSGDDVDQHLARITEVVQLEAHAKSEEGVWLDLFRAGNLHRTLVVGGVFVCQELAGVQFVLGFSTYFFELAGFPTAEAFQLGVGTLAIAVVGNFIGLALINRVGRRALFIWGMVACALDCLGLGVAALIPGQNALWAQAVFTMVYMLAYQGGIGPVAYALCAELGSAKLKSKTVGWGVAVNQLFVGITQVYLPYVPWLQPSR